MVLPYASATGVIPFVSKPGDQQVSLPHGIRCQLLVEIDGDKYNGVMAPHPDLTDQEIADVLTYVRNSFGNKASAVTAAQVKAVRATNKPKS